MFILFVVICLFDLKTSVNDEMTHIRIEIFLLFSTSQ